MRCAWFGSWGSRRARLHPGALLTAMRTYAAGRGVRGSGSWAPVPEVAAALARDEPTGKRWFLALDVSGSMVAGVPNLSAREASAAMVLATAATEPAYDIIGFTGRGYGSTSV